MKKYLWLIALTIWLAFLTWNTWPRNVVYWMGIAYKAKAELSEVREVFDREDRKLENIQQQSLEEAIKIYDSTFAQIEDSSEGK